MILNVCSKIYGQVKNARQSHNMLRGRYNELLEQRLKIKRDLKLNEKLQKHVQDNMFSIIIQCIDAIEITVKES